MAVERTLFEISNDAGSDLSSKQYYLVKRSGGNLALCDTAGERPLGILQDDPDASGRSGLVAVGGLSKVILGGTVAQDDLLTTDANGKAVAVSDDGGFAFGVANRAGVASDIIDCLMFAQGYGSAKGVIPLLLTSARELSSNDIINAAGNGGLLAKDTTPILEAINAGTDQQLQLNWASSNSDALTWQVPLPQDLDPSAAITLHARAKMAGATDTPTLTWAAFFGIGDTNCGGATAALSSTVSEVTRSIAASDVASPPGELTVTLTPGAHTTDALYLYSAWIEYTRK